MKSFSSVIVANLIILIAGNSCQMESTKEKEISKQYKAYVNPDDPLKVHHYTLDNGLKVLISPDHSEPRVAMHIVVHAGSIHEPEHATGLAHYLEHMMFKGTDKIGTTNWEEESKYLKQLEDLFEQLRQEEDPAKQKAIYKQIDSISQLAAQYAIPSEYEHMYQLIGGTYLNAGTDYDFTVYYGYVPSNEFRRLLILEKERFSKVVPRLFHTELETVFEEFNMTFQDGENYRAIDKIFAMLYPNHPYSRSVIGLPDHLKRPSIKEMLKFFDKYYVPNNMTVIVTGDVDPDEAIRLIDSTLGQLKPKPVDKPQFTLPPIPEGVQKAEQFGPKPAYVLFGFRVPEPSNLKEFAHRLVTEYLLSNSTAGILNLELVQKHRVHNINAFTSDYGQGGVFFIRAFPRQGQTLEQVEQEVLNVLRQVRSGDLITDDLVEASKKNILLEHEKSWESYMDKIEDLEYAIRLGLSWDDYLKVLDYIKQTTRDDVLAFLNKYIADNYAVLYKRQGEPKDRIYLEKPPITPVQANTEAHSEFYKQFVSLTPEPIKPKFVDFDKDIQKANAGPWEVQYIKNDKSNIFRLYLRYDFGTHANPALEVAFRAIPFLGADTLSPQQFRFELFKHGLKLYSSVRANEAYIKLEGLEESLDEGLQLLNLLLTKPVLTEEVLKNINKDIIKSRENLRNSDRGLLVAGYNYALFREESPFIKVLSEKELDTLSVDYILSLIKNLAYLPHKVWYYGKQEPSQVAEKIASILPSEVKEPFFELKTLRPKSLEDKVAYVILFPKVQISTYRFAENGEITLDNYANAQLFSSFYGGSLGSVINQEIREKRALAYSAGGFFILPAFKGDRILYSAYSLVQFDKLEENLAVIEDLMTTFKATPKHFEVGKQSLKQELETERITGEEVFFFVDRSIKRGFSIDPRKHTYEVLKSISYEDYKDYFMNNIANGRSIYILIMNEDAFKQLKLDGYKIVKLAPEDIIKI